MYDLITIGSISIDMYYRGDSLTQKEGRFHLAVGGKYLTDFFYMGLGGGAANVAIGVQDRGYKTAIMGKIGDNYFKDIIHKHLKDHNIPSDLCQLEKDYLKISSILLSQNGERTIIHYETPHEHIIRSDEDLQKLEKTKILYMPNLWRVPLEERKKILSHLASKGILAIVNLGIADCRRPIEQIQDLTKHVNILLINTHEFAELVKKPFESFDFRENITAPYDFLKTKIVIVTDGDKGAYAYVDGGVLHEPPHKVEKIVDTTGAGDAFSAGFIAGYLETNNIQKAMHEGSNHAVKVIQKIGAN
jgi:sugar/nucleoside kinase (ribokinase family)